MKLSHLPLRLATGAFILNSGIGKMGLDREGAAGLQSMAAQVVPSLGDLEPEKFGKLLAYGETALGSALLLPMVPSKLAGLGLAAFGGTLFAIYLKTPGMTQDDGVRPTQEGTALAKDVWLAAAGLALLLDRKRKKIVKKAPKAPKAVHA